jgi:hypothetical protein
MVKAEINPEYREAALDGLRPFYHDYLNKTMDYQRLHLVLGNKSAFKNLRALKDALFDYNNERKRTHWEDKLY